MRSAYAHAQVIQRQQGAIVWPDFTEASIHADIDARCLYRVMDGDALVGVFSIAYDDAAIWGDRERGAHLYLHRIARAQGSQRGGLVASALTWARAHCRALERECLRLDTWASNATLIAFYEGQGFRVVDRRRFGVDPRLPSNYHGNEFALLEEYQVQQVDDQSPAGAAR
ncbi:MAG: GNAT family N-acetyltransferase [Gemmatimonadaceae bacterium]